MEADCCWGKSSSVLWIGWAFNWQPISVLGYDWNMLSCQLIGLGLDLSVLPELATLTIPQHRFHLPFSKIDLLSLSGSPLLIPSFPGFCSFKLKLPWKPGSFQSLVFCTLVWPYLWNIFYLHFPPRNQILSYFVLFRAHFQPIMEYGKFLLWLNILWLRQWPLIRGWPRWHTDLIYILQRSHDR